MLEEAVDVIRALWTGESVTHRGRYYTVEDARIFDLYDDPILNRVDSLLGDAAALPLDAHTELGARLFQPCEDILDPVQAGENDADPLDGDWRPVAVLTHQRLGGMGELGEPIQAEKATRPLDRMNQAEDGVEHLPVVRLLLEPHEIDVELVEPPPGRANNRYRLGHIPFVTAIDSPRWWQSPAPGQGPAGRTNTSGTQGARYGSVNFSRVPGRLGTSRYLEGRLLDRGRLGHIHEIALTPGIE